MENNKKTHNNKTAHVGREDVRREAAEKKRLKEAEKLRENDVEKAYEYARKGQTVEIEPRKIEIMEISLIKFENNIITFSTSCSKGTYIRVLCEDIAEKLGTVGLMQNLIRTRVDKFDIKDSFTLENVEKANIIGIEEIFINNKKNNFFILLIIS